MSASTSAPPSAPPSGSTSPFPTAATVEGGASQPLPLALGDIKHGVDGAVGGSEEWVESLRCSVREKPFGALLVALAAGMLVARFTSR